MKEPSLAQAKSIVPTVVLKQAVPGLTERALAGFIVKACRAAAVPGGVTVLVTSNREMRALNSRFRGKKSATDVLSFPSAGLAHDFAGDIAISLETAERNAQLLGHSLADEVRILVLHGILHLAGYDHEQDDGQMAKKEQRLRHQLGLPSGLIERASARRRTRPARLRT
jgi:probable rRNA maturation factor